MNRIKIFSVYLILFTTIINSNVEQNVFKKVLNNGMTVLVRKNTTIPSVTLQLFYNVGSKDEQTNEKGLAHLLEHMVFKGTKEKLSETDIQAVTHKLSGYCNAHTYYDWTSYEFQLPSRHWHEALPILADCMTNCTFKQDLLNAEFKAVIQELKMGRDRYENQLYVELLSTIFPDHPYHYPVIGFKQDIWNINSENLTKFYKKHYKPNNATLVVVGDVNPIEVFDQTEKYFANIPEDKDYKKEKFYCNNDIVSRSVTLYRDSSKSAVVLAFIIPGIENDQTFALDATCNVLGSGASSRLYQKLVEETKLAKNIGSFNWQLFNHGLFVFYFEPKKIEDSELIIKLITFEIESLKENGITETEAKKIVNNLKYHYFKLIEDNEAQAQCIGEYYLAKKDENYLFNYFNYDITKLSEQIKNIITKYFRPCLMHKGYLLPIPENEKNNLLELQEQYDQEDSKVLNERIRQSEVEPEKYAKSIKAKPVSSYNFPKPETFELKNGIKIFTYNNTNTPTICLNLDLKVNSDYDDINKPGTLSLMTSVLAKGTKKRNYKELSQELESHAIHLNIYNSAGKISISTLNSEIEKALEILFEILTEPSFDDLEIEKERDHISRNLKAFWDHSHNIATNILITTIYKNHPFNKRYIITEEHLKNITKEDLINFFNKYISPSGARISMSGDLTKINIKQVLEKTIGKWTGPEIEDIKYPKVEKNKAEVFNHFINRDQIDLNFATVTINRFDKDFDKLIIFNQILSGSMDSKLFKLREKTGYFYYISGTTTFHSGKETGMLLINTQVSKENLNDAEDLILKTIDEVADTITDEEVEQAKNAIINSLIFEYQNNESISSTLLFLDEYNYPFDYFDNRGNDLKKITTQEVKDAVKKYLNSKSLLKIQVGRI